MEERISISVTYTINHKGDFVSIVSEGQDLDIGSMTEKDVTAISEGSRLIAKYGVISELKQGLEDEDTSEETKGFYKSLLDIITEME